MFYKGSAAISNVAEQANKVKLGIMEEGKLCVTFMPKNVYKNSDKNICKGYCINSLPRVLVSSSKTNKETSGLKRHSTIQNDRKTGSPRRKTISTSSM